MNAIITTEQIDAEISAIDGKLKELEPLRRRRDALVALRATYADDPRQPRLLDAPSSAPASRFAGLGTTEAMNAYLAESPGTFRSPREIAKGLIAAGYTPSSPNFQNIVFTTCKRKAETGAYEATERDGKKVFRLPISNQP